MDGMKSNLRVANVYALHSSTICASVRLRVSTQYRLHDVESMLLFLCTVVFVGFSLLFFPIFIALRYKANARTHKYNRKYFYCVVKINCVRNFLMLHKTEHWTKVFDMQLITQSGRRTRTRGARSCTIFSWLLVIEHIHYCCCCCCCYCSCRMACDEYVHHYLYWLQSHNSAVVFSREKQ